MPGRGYPEIGDFTLYPEKVKTILQKILDLLIKGTDRIDPGALVFE